MQDLSKHCINRNSSCLVFCYCFVHSQGGTYGHACEDQTLQLPDLSRRSSSYFASRNEPLVRDSLLLSSWYNANDDKTNLSYTILNGQTPEYESCGTQFPVYIKGLIFNCFLGLVCTFFSRYCYRVLFQYSLM